MAVAFAIYYLFGQAALLAGLHTIDIHRAAAMRCTSTNPLFWFLAMHLLLLVWPYCIYRGLRA